MITSRTNDRIRSYRGLIAKPEAGLVTLEGPRLIEDCAASGASFRELFVTPKGTGWPGYHRIRSAVSISGGTITEVSEDILGFMCDVEHPQGMAAIAEWHPAKEISPERPVVALDGVQDPGNVGTVIRTAAALGFGAVILGGSTARGNSPKVARASMGSIFRIPVLHVANLAGSLAGMKDCGFKVAALDSLGEPLSGLNLDSAVCLVVGAEAQGISDEVRAISDVVLSIPMSAGVESLNASVAAALAMWELSRNA
jgi:TrmH family RNA methyltransferase